MNLYHKVEAAFDGMADALKAAMNVADNSEETELYSDLSIDIESLRDDAQSLYKSSFKRKMPLRLLQQSKRRKSRINTLI